MEYILNDLSIEIHKVPATILFVNDLFPNMLEDFCCTWVIILSSQTMPYLEGSPQNCCRFALFESQMGHVNPTCRKYSFEGFLLIQLECHL